MLHISVNALGVYNCQRKLDPDMSYKLVVVLVSTMTNWANRQAMLGSTIANSTNEKKRGSIRVWKINYAHPDVPDQALQNKARLCLAT